MGRIDFILETLNQLYPHAHCELNHDSNFQLLIAVMLSAQTTDRAVNALTSRLFPKYPTIEAFMELSVEQLANELKRIGLYKTKAQNILKTCEILKNKHHSEIPNTLKELEELPGVGRKTANVVLSVAYHIPRIAVDTHVERVSKRLKIGYLKDTPLQIEEKLMRKIPKNLWIRTHHQMIFFGRYHCTAKVPKCEGCLLKFHCRYPNI